VVDVCVSKGLYVVELVDLASITNAVILDHRAARLRRPVSPLLPVLSLVKESVRIFSSLSLDKIHRLLELSLQGNVAVELLLVVVGAINAMDIKAIVGSFVFVDHRSGCLADLCLLEVLLLCLLLQLSLPCILGLGLLFGSWRMDNWRVVWLFFHQQRRAVDLSLFHISLGVVDAVRNVFLFYGISLCFFVEDRLLGHGEKEIGGSSGDSEIAYAWQFLLLLHRIVFNWVEEAHEVVVNVIQFCFHLCIL